MKRLSFAIVLASAAVPAVLTAQAHPNVVPGAPSPDPRVGLRAGITNAAEAAWNLRLVSNTPAAEPFRASPGDFRYMNSDLAFARQYVIQGNFQGLQVWDVSSPAQPKQVLAMVCPGAQNDVSVHRNLLFVSVEDPGGRLDCGAQGIQDSVSRERVVGIRIFDITDISKPRPITSVQTCRGSHTHTLVTDSRDSADVYVYVSGSGPVRSPSELPGCAESPRDPNTALFRIEVIKVPLANPSQAAIVSSPRIFEQLTDPGRHPEAPEDIAAAAKVAGEARARGMFTATVQGMEVVLPPGFVRPMLDSVVRARGGTGAPTAADSAALRGGIQAVIDRMVSGPPDMAGRGPTQCHDITVYPAIGRAGGACGGYGLLLDISDPVNPRRIDAVADSNMGAWHSATFNNDGTRIMFTDEWGGGTGPRCRVTDRVEWGANAIFVLDGDKMRFRSYYKLPAAQTPFENCVAHNGSLIPVPGRDLMVQGWYQGGISVIDWTDPAKPVEIAFFDRGPMDSTKMLFAGSWSAYWHNGHIYSSEIARGLDIFELVASQYLSENELAAAKLVRFEVLNVQTQPKLEWPADFVMARAYLDQLARSNGLASARIDALRSALAAAERQAGPARRTALTRLATELDAEAASSPDQAKVRALASVTRALAAGR
ncbi:MAG: LVIVD repeat-containing protein [Gemmatimonadales bacterium]